MCRPAPPDLRQALTLLAAIAAVTGAAELLWRVTGPHPARPAWIWAAP